MKLVRMIPPPDGFGPEENGIKRVVQAYAKYLPDFGWQVVTGKEQPYDIRAVHAGVLFGDVAHLHGLYWTADYVANNWEWRANQTIADSLRGSRIITVPSEWVAETIRRDMHINPYILPHGIDWQEWQKPQEREDFVLWNKNRTGDVCNPDAIMELGRRYAGVKFVCTFAPAEARGMQNVNPVGLMSYLEMMRLVKACRVYLSTTKETWGIGILEAMAGGAPVLGFAEGGILNLVEHGVNGYLASPGDYEDLARGLSYCIEYSKILGGNGREMAKRWPWEKAVEQVARVYDIALTRPEPSIAVVIPTYNYKDKVIRAILSAADQTHPPQEIIVVDDGSTDGTYDLLVKHQGEWKSTYPAIDFMVISQPNQGVACARNNGISHARSKYICCLDADDAIDHQFLEACWSALETDPSLGIAYTGLFMVNSKGEGKMSPWPGAFDYNGQIQKRNQIPTCCLFRRSIWERSGGYRQRYAPGGAGAEDAELWLKAGALGFNAKQVTEAGLFIYSFGTGRVTGDKEYHEPDWTVYHPWIKDEKPPFISIATPRHFSHPVRQYDQPQVSVIIPVGPGHKHLVGNAVDSLEAQTFRKWELIIVDDTGDPGEEWVFDANREVAKAWPFVKFLTTQGKEGAGAARNLGASVARAPLLLFLDADDWLAPDALEKMVLAWNVSGEIVYTDYLAKCYLSQEEANKGMQQGRLKRYDPITQEAIIVNHTLDFDCNLAIDQPGKDRLYQWCLISSLVPKLWHDEVGGFDEHMPAWEDWQYFIDLARAGHCFTRIPEPLMIYRFATGSRREFADPLNKDGRQNAKKLLQYMEVKKAQAEKTMCGCHGSANITTTSQPIQAASRDSYGRYPAQSGGMKMDSTHPGNYQDADFVECVYRPGMAGDHQVIGMATRINYQRHQENDVFLVHKDDMTALPEAFVPTASLKKVPVQEVVVPPPPVPVGVAEAEPVVVKHRATRSDKGLPKAKPTAIIKDKAE